MKIARMASIALPVAALAAASLPLAANAANTANGHEAKAHEATPTAAVYTCVNKPVVRPGEYDIFCDGSNYLVKLRWTSWNTTEASATGVEWINNCTPNCAAGKFSHSDVVVVLWDAKPVKGHHDAYGFTKMTLLYPATGKTATSTPPGEFPGEF